MANLPKFSRIFPEINKNQYVAQSDLDSEIIRTIDFRSETYLKGNTTIILLENNFIVESDSAASVATAQNNVSTTEDEEDAIAPYAYRFLFLDLPDSLLNSLYVSIYVYRSEIASGIENFTWFNQCFTDYLWEKVDNINYRLHLHVSAKRGVNFEGALVNASVTYFNSAIRKVI